MEMIKDISIHASRGGSDPIVRGTDGQEHYFNPRFPRGKRLPCDRWEHHLASISIHASRGGSDSTVKLSPYDRTRRHGFREPGFSGFLSAVSMLFFFWALRVRAYRIMVSLGSYPFFVPI